MAGLVGVAAASLIGMEMDTLANGVEKPSLVKEGEKMVIDFHSHIIAKEIFSIPFERRVLIRSYREFFDHVNKGGTA